MVLPLLLCALAPAGLLEQLPPQVGSAADMEQMHSYLSAGSPRPLAAQMPGRPAAAATPAEPMTPATDLQGALRMSMGSLMGFCRCEGGAPCPTPAARASPRASPPLSSPFSLPRPTCAPPRCAACESVLGDLIDNLEDDFPGRQYTEGDIYALINDRFCYGTKWVFRSSVRSRPPSPARAEPER